MKARAGRRGAPPKKEITALAQYTRALQIIAEEGRIPEFGRSLLKAKPKAAAPSQQVLAQHKGRLGDGTKVYRRAAGGGDDDHNGGAAAAAAAPGGAPDGDAEEMDPLADAAMYNSLCAGQKAWNSKVIEHVQSENGKAFARRSRAMYEPPDPIKNPTYNGAEPAYVFAPNRFHGSPYPPPPCPRCKWDSTVLAKGGWHQNGRRVMGVAHDFWLLGPTMWCKDCHEQRKKLEEAGDEAYKRHTYTYQTYNEESLRL